MDQCATVARSCQLDSALDERSLITFRFPSTRLGRLARAKTRHEAMEHSSIYYSGTVPEFFFDRNPENFSSILGKTFLKTTMIQLE